VPRTIGLATVKIGSAEAETFTKTTCGIPRKNTHYP
jgi:hypothetical protein